MAIGFFIGGLLGWGVTEMFYTLGKYQFDRTHIDQVLKDMLGSHRIEHSLADEVLMVAYSYNAQEPRFYTKYLAKTIPDIYNVTMDVAAAASSATPLYFEPYVHVNGRNQTEVLIDGGIIAYNPSFYAFIHAAENLKKKDLRIISLGTGLTTTEKYNAKQSMDTISWLMMLEDILVNVEITSHAFISQYLGAPEYKRF
jgi:patatin-like phospholipase/acyl hydrolase